MKKKVILIVVTVFIIGLISVFFRPKDPVDPPVVSYVYSHENELLEKARKGDESAIEQLIFAYEFVGDDAKRDKVLELSKLKNSE